MLCPECRNQNPDANRFCGQCGHPLVQQPRSNYPPEGYDEVDVPAVSDAGLEFADLKPRVPANEYAPPPSKPSPRDVARPEAKEPKPVRETYRSSSTTHIFDLEPREDLEPPEPGTTSGRFETDPHAVEPIATSTQAAEFESTPERAIVGAVHGPSFLGLGEPDLLDEIEEPPSHARRNWLIFALLAVMAIAAAQWRSIRDTGMQYAGTMRLNLPLKKGEQAQTPPVSDSKASGETSTGADNPDIVVGPTNNSAQSSQQAAQSSSDESKSSDSSTKENSAASNTAKPDVEKSSNDNDSATGSAEGHAKDSPSAKKDEEDSDTAASDDSSATDEKPATASKRSPSKQAAKEAKSSVNSAGAEDVARAEAASDPTTAVNWLWAATKKGNSEAPVRLADLYANGRGVPKNCEQATILLRSSGSHGNPRAQARLGMYYATGKCVELDRAQAWHWLTLAHESDPGSDWIQQYRARLWAQMSAAERARSGGSRGTSE